MTVEQVKGHIVEMIKGSWRGFADFSTSYVWFNREAFDQLIYSGVIVRVGVISKSWPTQSYAMANKETTNEDK